jgi:hypothetical protein
MFRARALAVSTLLVLPRLTVAGPADDGRGTWAMKPVPDWVDVLTVPADAQVPTQDVSWGTHFLLADQQIRVGDGPTARYQHSAWKVLSSAGLEEGSSVRISFDPSYQKLALHHVRLLRDGQSVGTFTPEDVKILHNEDELDHRIYNGTLTALVFLKDVRPGDVVDYAYTVSGDNPIFAGHFADDLTFGYSVPVSRIRHRLLWPRPRTLHYKAHGTVAAPRTQERGDTVVYEWEQSNVPPVLSEGDTPDWYTAGPWVQLTDYGTWNDVARWAAALYVAPSPLPAELRRLAERWRSEADEEARARAAVRMVQDEVRYLGIEIGPNSHQPHPPQQVLAQRFGDCKDKAFLLSVLLGEMGIEAHPALVDSRHGHVLDEWLPSPYAFDHVIVQARVGGKPVWIDATQSRQGGAVTSFPPPPFERALPVRADADRLVPIPLPAAEEPTTVIEETYRPPQAGHGAQLEVRTTYRAGDADDIRAELDSQSAAERARKYLNFYAQQSPNVRTLHPPAVSDSRDTNVVVVSEAYELPEFWDDGTHDFQAWPVAQELHAPATLLRTAPLEVRYPVHLRYQLRIESPRLPAFLPPSAEVRDGAFRFAVHSERTAGAALVTYDYRTLADSVAAPEVRKHLDKIDEVRRHLRYRLDRDGPTASPAADNDVLLGLGALVGLIVVGFVAVQSAAAGRRWQRRTEFAKIARFAGGVAPESALPAADHAAVDDHLAAIRCACGAANPDPGQRSDCRYDGRIMTIVARVCPGCGRTQTLYFDVDAVQRR